MPRQSVQPYGVMSKAKFGSLQTAADTFGRKITGSGIINDLVVYGETTQAAGTPTPVAPIPIISTTGNVTVRSASPSKNLFDAGVGITSGFYYDAGGTAVVSASYYIQTAYIPVLPNTTYTMSHAGAANPKILQYTSAQGFISRTLGIGVTSVTVTTSSTTAFIRLSSATAQLATTQLEAGAVATAFVAHTVSTQTIPLGTTRLRSLPNGVSDRIYKTGANWFLEQNIETATFSGVENYVVSVSSGSPTYTYAYTNAYDATLPNVNTNSTSIMSEKTAIVSLLLGSSVVSTDTASVGGSGTERLRLYILSSRLSASNNAGVKAYLASNPFTFQYASRNPLTTQITDPAQIAALENIALYQGITNITAGTPLSGSYALPNGRQLSTGRMVLRDMQASLSFDGLTSKVLAAQASGLPIFSTTGYSVAGRFNPGVHPSTQGALYAEASTASNNQLLLLGHQSSTKKFVVTIRNDANVAQISALNSTTTIRGNSGWHDFVWTDNNGVAKLYIDGVLDATSYNYTPAGPYTFNRSSMGIIERFSGTVSAFKGSIAEVCAYSRVLSAQEAADFHTGKLVSAAGTQGRWDLGEGAGTTAYDTSGNSNHGVISVATYTNDVPIKSRQPIDRNLIYNGDFEYAPPFVAAQISTGGYIDGTAGGSSTNMLFGWALSFVGGSVGVSFDTTVAKSGGTSIKLSTLNTSGNLVVGQSITPAAPTALEARTLLAAVLPNTSYTLTAWVKTNNVVTNSAFVDIREFTGGLGSSTTTSSNKLSGTNDWTQVAVTVVTASTTRYIGILLRNAIPGNVSDAWFDNIELRPTTPTTRQLIT